MSECNLVTVQRMKVEQTLQVALGLPTIYIYICYEKQKQGPSGKVSEQWIVFT